MTRDYVCDKFISRGFNLREVKSPDYTVIEHNGEPVGCIYDDSVYVAQNYPSLNHGTSQEYADTPKTIVMFTHPIKMVEQAIDFLLDSPSRIDKETREKRIKNIRKYFQERELKRLRRNELIASLERGEHLSREELRELSAMGYTT